MRSHKVLYAVMLAASLVSFTGCAATDRHDSTGQYIDDTAITTKVKAAIFGDPQLKLLEIKVVTFKGVVQLSGFVGTREEELRAVALARNVDGVKAVQDNMSLK